MNVAHDGCVKMLCGKLDVKFDLSDRDTLVKLVELNELLGTTVFGGYEGIDYSDGKLDKRWITQPCGGEGNNVFAWDFENGHQDWTLKRYTNIPNYYYFLPNEKGFY